MSNSNFLAEAVRMNTEDRQAAAFDTGRTQDPEIGSFLHKFAAMEEEHERMTWVPKK